MCRMPIFIPCGWFTSSRKRMTCIEIIQRLADAHKDDITISACRNPAVKTAPRPASPTASRQRIKAAHGGGAECAAHDGSRPARRCTRCCRAYSSSQPSPQQLPSRQPPEIFYCPVLSFETCLLRHLRHRTAHAAIARAFLSAPSGRLRHLCQRIPYALREPLEYLACPVSRARPEPRKQSDSSSVGSMD